MGSQLRAPGFSKLGKGMPFFLTLVCFYLKGYGAQKMLSLNGLLMLSGSYNMPQYLCIILGMHFCQQHEAAEDQAILGYQFKVRLLISLNAANPRFICHSTWIQHFIDKDIRSSQLSTMLGILG